MANFVISAAGAAVGYFVGGPLGAQVGWMLASYATAEQQAETGQATIGDLRVQTSQYGVNIPVVIGKQRISGNIIWASEKRPYQITSEVGGGKGGSSTQVVGTGYKVDLTIALCKGPILGISRVWADGQFIVDARTTANPLVGNLYVGSNTQNPDSTMEAALGAGNVPAYRGLAYIVLSDYDLGVTGRIPIFSFEVVREGGL